MEGKEKGILLSGEETLLEYISTYHPHEGEVCKAILFESHKQLGEKDALYGCNSIFDDSGRTKLLIEEDKRFKAMGLLDSLIGSSSRHWAEKGIFKIFECYVR